MNNTNPMQPLIMVDGQIRFKENKLVRMLVDISPMNLSQLSLLPFDADDWAQLMQLVGYSLTGYSEISKLKMTGHYQAAMKQANEIWPNHQNDN